MNSLHSVKISKISLKRDWGASYPVLIHKLSTTYPQFVENMLCTASVSVKNFFF